MYSPEYAPKIPSKNESSADKLDTSISSPTNQKGTVGITDAEGIVSRSKLQSAPDAEDAISYLGNKQEIADRQAVHPPNSSEQVKSEKATKEFIWELDLSKNAQKLYLLLLGEQGDIDVLPKLAKFEGFDLEAALEELREFDVLDESDSKTIFLNIFRKKY